jgi:amino-acid N-acetyltransferase
MSGEKEMIRNARMEDIKGIYAMLQHFAQHDLLLGRSLSSLYDQLRDFKVFVDEEKTNSREERNPPLITGSGARVVGVCSLHICWEDLAEIRSLAVAESHQGRGIGTKLVQASLAEAVTFGINRVFTLTYQPSFFRHLGFKDIDKGELPHKVWSDCVHCPKFPDCNEEALIWEQ